MRVNLDAQLPSARTSWLHYTLAVVLSTGVVAGAERRAFAEPPKTDTVDEGLEWWCYRYTFHDFTSSSTCRRSQAECSAEQQKSENDPGTQSTDECRSQVKAWVVTAFSFVNDSYIYWSTRSRANCEVPRRYARTNRDEYRDVSTCKLVGAIVRSVAATSNIPESSPGNDHVESVKSEFQHVQARNETAAATLASQSREEQQESLALAEWCAMRTAIAMASGHRDAELQWAKEHHRASDGALVAAYARSIAWAKGRQDKLAVTPEGFACSQNHVAIILMACLTGSPCSGHQATLAESTRQELSLFDWREWILSAERITYPRRPGYCFGLDAAQQCYRTKKGCQGAREIVSDRNLTGEKLPACRSKNDLFCTTSPNELRVACFATMQACRGREKFLSTRWSEAMSGCISSKLLSPSIVRRGLF
jgi:hypothetical protein